MARFKVSGAGYIDTTTGAFIPNDPRNRHFREMQQWLAEGNTLDPEFTLEEAAENEKRKELFSLAQHVANGIRTILKVDVAIYQVGRAKGLWSKADFDNFNPTLIDDVIALKAKLDRLEELEQS